MDYPKLNSIEFKKQGSTLVFKSTIYDTTIKFYHRHLGNGDSFSLHVSGKWLGKWYIKDNKALSDLSKINDNKDLNEILSLFFSSLRNINGKLWNITIDPNIYEIDYVFGATMPIYDLRYSGVSLKFLSSLFKTYYFCLRHSEYNESILLLNSVEMANNFMLLGDTVSSIKALLFDHSLPPSICKILFQFHYQHFSVIQLIEQSINVAGIDNTRNLLTALSNKPDILLSTTHMQGVLYLLTQGISAKKIINYIEKINPSNPKKADMLIFLQDISLMTDIILKDGPAFNKPSNIKSIIDYHDYLSALVTDIQLKKEQLYKQAHISLFTDYANSKYKIRAVTSTSELINIGTQMHHCVARYMNGHAKGDCEILIVTPVDNPNLYLVCIELKAPDPQDLTKNTYVNQAKLKYNKPVASHSKLEFFVQSYCYANSIVSLTPDLPRKNLNNWSDS